MGGEENGGFPVGVVFSGGGGKGNGAPAGKKKPCGRMAV